jgi:hypothetical protein
VEWQYWLPRLDVPIQSAVVKTTKRAVAIMLIRITPIKA